MQSRMINRHVGDSDRQPGEPSRQNGIANPKEWVGIFGPICSVKDKGFEAIKKKAWDHVLRGSLGSDGAIMDIYSTAMRSVEQQAKKLYGGIDTGRGSEFQWMMIKDGCLYNQVVLLILGCSEQLGYPREDPIFGRVLKKKETKKWIEALFCPSNQLPLVVLRVLMNQAFFQCVIDRARWDSVPSGWCTKVLYELLVLPSLKKTHERSLLERVRLVFVDGCRDNNVEQPQPRPHPQPSNLLDGFRGILMGPSSRDHRPTSEGKTDVETDSDDDQDEIGDTNGQRDLFNDTSIFLSATELKQKGIHIKVLESRGARAIHCKINCLWAHIYLPTIQLDSNSECLLRNLKNYGSFQNRQEVMLYLKMMSNLIQTARDAKLLQKIGVIHGSFNNIDRLPAMLKRLTHKEDVTLTQQVRIMRSQIRDYNGLWAQLIFYGRSVATFFFIFEMVQAWFAVLSYYKTNPKCN